jgi:hypothetical protein
MKVILSRGSTIKRNLQSNICSFNESLAIALRNNSIVVNFPSCAALLGLCVSTARNSQVPDITRSKAAGILRIGVTSGFDR